MKKFFKRLLAFNTIICIILSLTLTGLAQSAIAVEDTMAGLTQNEIDSGQAGPYSPSYSARAGGSQLSLTELKAKFPQGRYWNGGNVDGTTGNPCTCHSYCSWNNPGNCNVYSGAIQCMGFAFKLGADAYGGVSPRNSWTMLEGSAGRNYVLNSLKPGDIVRYGTHSVFVVNVSGSIVTLGECNYGSPCIIRWDRTMTRNELSSTNFDNVRVAPYSLLDNGSGEEDELKRARLVGDINGDGYDDYIQVWNKSGKRAFVIYLGQANGYFSTGHQSFTDFNYGADINGIDKGCLADVNGDGRDDYVHIWEYNGKRTFVINLGQADGYFSAGHQTFTDHNYGADSTGRDKGWIADVNGDGCDDYVVVWEYYGKRTFLVNLGQTDGYFSAGQQTFTDHNYGADSTGKDKGWIADVNGDGCDDYVHVWEYYGKRTFLVNLGQTDGYFSAGQQTFTDFNYGADSIGRDKGWIADVNGDGCDDYVVVWDNNGKRTFVTFPGQANGYFGVGRQTFTDHNYGADPIGRDKGWIADVNGDGRDDYVHVWDNNGKRTFMVNLGQADGYFSAGQQTFTDHNYGADFTGRDKGVVADVNGDGCDDYVHVWDNSGKRAFVINLGQQNGYFSPGHQSLSEFNY